MNSSVCRFSERGEGLCTHSATSTALYSHLLSLQNLSRANHSTVSSQPQVSRGMQEMQKTEHQSLIFLTP